jgi:lipoyl synthase
MSTLPVRGERSGLPSLPVLGADLALQTDTVALSAPIARSVERRLPKWLKRPLPTAGGMSFTRSLVSELGLETVCESARCPNRSECWTRRTATFMILGDVCTRPCGFCAVKRGQPEEVAIDEPERLAEACHRLGLRHVVITSVTRDDLPDGGAEHFRQCVLAVRRRTDATIEVLTPDFAGRGELIDFVLSATPEVFNHNLETVARLQRHVRRKSQYQVSLAVLEHVKKTRPEIRTKSGLMLGLGETTEELFETLADLRSIGCDLLTLGQYLQPSPRHLPVERYLPAEEFDELGRLAHSLGFANVACGPFVRSSYHAEEMARLDMRAGLEPQRSRFRADSDSQHAIARDHVPLTD